MSEPVLRSLYISHGGGPLPLLGDPAHAELVRTLGELADVVPRPEAIIVVSAHWEAPVATVTTAARPALYYDYYGFPEASYRIRYPAPGAPGLAGRVRDCLAAHGLAQAGDATRGFDHGLFVPLKLMYPEAEIPCIQLSLLQSMDPAAHLRLGEALADLSSERLLVLGSGSSFHNLQAFFGQPGPELYARNQAFENWLAETLTDTALPEAQRRQRLLDWERAPHARYCHPREEHLLPLHVCYGLSAAPASRAFRFTMMGMHGSCYLW
ncbi:DODA-type extradiol aromatic ring-opening family dioxygenase [Haliea atlantica]|jgi:aromatic ring-opening dioxygenase catalytic subunit (LigB family)